MTAPVILLPHQLARHEAERANRPSPELLAARRAAWARIPDSEPSPGCGCVVHPGETHAQYVDRLERQRIAREMDAVMACAAQPGADAHQALLAMQALGADEMSRLRRRELLEQWEGTES